MIQKIKTMISSKAVGNGLWMYLLQFFNAIIPLITLPYVTRILGTSQYGIFSTSFNLVGYLQVVVDYGFSMSATREVALMGDSTKKISKLFSAVFYSKAILVVACCLFSVCYLGVWRPSNIQKLSYWMLMLTLIGIFLQVDWLFQGLQDMKYISIANIVARTITTILIFVGVRSYEDILLYCFLYSLSPIISNLIGIIIVKCKYKLKLCRVSFNEIKNEFKTGWYIFTTQLTSKVFGSIGITFLTFLATKSTVGIFSAIQKIPNILLLLWLPISQVLYPIVSKKMDDSFLEGKKFVLKVRKYMLAFFLICTLLLSIFSKLIVQIAFGSAYSSEFFWLIPLLFWVLFSIDNNFWGIQILLGSGHDKQYSFCFQISVIVTIILNLVFIYLWGGLGASLAPLVSEIILDILLIRTVNKIKI